MRRRSVPRRSASGCGCRWSRGGSPASLRIHPRSLRGNPLPARLLGIGLPLTVALGTLAALVVLSDLERFDDGLDSRVREISPKVHPRLRIARS